MFKYYIARDVVRISPEVGEMSGAGIILDGTAQK